MIENYNEIFTDPEYEKAYHRIKTDIVDKVGVTPVENPTAVILGGLPGAGKSNLYKIYDHKLDNNIVHIDCDIFRKFHPYIDKAAYTIQELKDDKYAKDTNDFVFSVEKRLMNELSQNHYSFIVESAMKKPNTAFYAANVYKDMGYNVELAVMGTSIEDARKGTIARFDLALKTYTEEKENDSIITDVPRPVPDDFFNSVKENIENSFTMIYEAKNAQGEPQIPVDDIYIYTRSGDMLYHEQAAPTLSPVPILNARLHNSSEEAEKIIDAYYSDYIMSEIATDQKLYNEYLKFQGKHYSSNVSSLEFFYDKEKKADGSWSVDSSNISSVKRSFGVSENSTLISGLTTQLSLQKIVECMKAMEVQKDKANDVLKEYLKAVEVSLDGRLSAGSDREKIFSDLVADGSFLKDKTIEQRKIFFDSVKENTAALLSKVELSARQSMENNLHL